MPENSNDDIDFVLLESVTIHNQGNNQFKNLHRNLGNCITSYQYFTVFWVICLSLFVNLCIKYTLCSPSCLFC